MARAMSGMRLGLEAQSEAKSSEIDPDSAHQDEQASIQIQVR